MTVQSPTSARAKAFAVALVATLNAAAAPVILFIALSFSTYAEMVAERREAMAGGAGLLWAVYVVAWFHAAVLGLPAYWFARRRGLFKWFTCLIGGAFIGALPLGMLLTLSELGGGVTSASVGGVPTVVNGVTTLAGWLQLLEIVAALACLGAAGGFAFWLSARASSARRLVWRALIIAVAVSTLIGLFAAPRALTDRSCHQVMTHGRTSASPSFSLQVPSGEQEWLLVSEALKELALEENMDVRSSDGRPYIVQISVCRMSGSVIEAIWTPDRSDEMAAQFGIAVQIFQTEEQSDWRALAPLLKAKLEKKLPGRVTVKPSDG
jgi:hypothetical protein